MIFVSVGTQKFPFDRLIKLVDDALSNMKDTEAFAQIGTSEYKPQNMQYADYLSKSEFEQKIKDCDLLITHSGVATIMAGLKEQKPVIVVPRLAQYKEHIDDHQLQVAETYSSNNYIIQYEDGQDISELIEKVGKFEFRRYVSNRENVVSVLKDYISTQQEQKKK